MYNLPKYIDLVFCLIVLPIMAIIFPVERWFHNFPRYVIAVAFWLYSLYFINRLLTVPFLFRDPKRRLISFMLIFLSLIITYGLSSITLYIPKPNKFDEGIFRIFPGVEQYQQAVWSLFMIVEAFSFAIGLLTQANEQRARRREVETERDKAEISLYKAQIKPHFMFNTLNSLYGLFLTHDDKALESLEKYISMLRYVYSSPQNDYVSLAEEMDYISQYVSLQSLRLNEMTKASLRIDVKEGNLQVPPVLLVTFVENCFKHGVSSIEKSEIFISITEKNGKLELTTRNRIFNDKRSGDHMGIENSRKRLGLLYPNRHSLEIEDDGNYFNVKLSIGLLS